MIEAAITKYFSRTKANEPVVILTDYSEDVHYLYTLLKRFLSKSERKIVCLSKFCPCGLLEQNEHVNQVKEYLKNPKGFLITDIDSFSGAQGRNIIVCTNQMANRYVRNIEKCWSYCYGILNLHYWIIAQLNGLWKWNTDLLSVDIFSYAQVEHKVKSNCLVMEDFIQKDSAVTVQDQKCMGRYWTPTCAKYIHGLFWLSWLSVYMHNMCLVSWSSQLQAQHKSFNMQTLKSVWKIESLYML